MLTAGAITGNRELVRQPGLPLAVLPVVAVAAPLIDLVAALPVLLLFLIIGGGKLTIAILVLPLLIVLQFFLIQGLGFLLASVNVTFRDTQHLLVVALMLMVYLTPVFYDAGMIPDTLRPVYGLNPMTQLIMSYRNVLLEGSMPDWRVLVILFSVDAAFLFVGWAAFVRARSSFVDEL